MNKHRETSIMLMLSLRDLAREKGITHQKIADKTGFQKTNVTRMLSGRYSPTLENFIRLADAINTYIFILDKDSDDDLGQIMKDRWGTLDKTQN